MDPRRHPARGGAGVDVTRSVSRDTFARLRVFFEVVAFRAEGARGRAANGKQTLSGQPLANPASPQNKNDNAMTPFRSRRPTMTGVTHGSPATRAALFMLALVTGLLTMARFAVT